MALDRWLALVILLICLAYGYAAYFTMDALLPPIMKRSPIWPSSFPKVLVIGGILLSLSILLGLEKSPERKTQRISTCRAFMNTRSVRRFCYSA